MFLQFIIVLYIYYSLFTVDQMLGDNESEEIDSKRKSKKKMKSKSKCKEVEEEIILEEVKQKHKPKKSKQKNSTKNEEKYESIIKNKESKNMKADKDTMSKLTTDIVCNVETSSDKSEKFTEDGFKIVSVVPDDDSDVSDAFESDGEEEDAFGFKSKKSVAQMTEDGFKIVSDIPPDDSDVSDAFEDDDDEDLDSHQNTAMEKHHRGSLKNVKKPILQIMNDFGLLKNDMIIVYGYLAYSSLFMCVFITELLSYYLDNK